MSLIKNATTYKLKLPKANAMGSHLSENKFIELGDHEFCHSGFEPLFDGFFVEQFPGGFAFNVRYDEKIIPASVVNEEAKKRIKKLECDSRVKLKNKLKASIKDQVYIEFLPVALIKQQVITCYYMPADELLIVPTSSKKLADIVTSRLVKAVESIKATTIYVDGITNSLTTKLRNHLNDDDSAFNGFDVTGTCKLKGEDGKAFSFKLDDIAEAKDGITESMNNGNIVTELGLSTEVMQFKINKDYIIKGIEFFTDSDDEEFDDARALFQHEASVQTALFSDINKALLMLFEYKEKKV